MLPGQLVPPGTAALVQGQLQGFPLRSKQGETGFQPLQGLPQGRVFRRLAGEQPAGVGGLRHHQLHVPVQGGAGAQQGHALHAGARQRLASGCSVDEHPLSTQLLKGFGQGGQLPGGRGPGQLDVAVGQGPQDSHRPQRGHHVGQAHHLKGGIAQREHAAGGGKQVSGFYVQVGFFGARHQVCALAVPAH